jgi:glyoxylate reductase
MSSLRVFVTRRIPEAGLTLLRKRRGLVLDVYKEDHAISRRELLKRIKNADILLSLLTDHIDVEVMDAAPHLQMIANYAVGFDNIDLPAAAKREITVTNTPAPEVSETVAEHAIALIFGLAHRIVEADDFTRQGKYHGWSPQVLLGTDVAGKTLGIIGGGAIGSALARRMHDGFDVRIAYHDVKRNSLMETAFDATYMSLSRLLKESDFVSVHVPLLPSTRHLISIKELRSMKKTAFLINTARGPVVDEQALIQALRKGTIAGAGIDVYEREPEIDANLRKLSNVILTPHTASATREARDAMSICAAQNIIAYVSGKRPENMVH